MLMWFFAKFGGFKDFVTTSTISHLTGEKLKTILIPVPNIIKQKQFSNIINTLNINKLNINRINNSSESLFNSLLQKAFNGELVA
jgi:type I restriction enzyme, S subunit